LPPRFKQPDNLTGQATPSDVMGPTFTGAVADPPVEPNQPQQLSDEGTYALNVKRFHCSLKLMPIFYHIVLQANPYSNNIASPVRENDLDVENVQNCGYDELFVDRLEHIKFTFVYI
jgi:hypothetical protein